MSRLTTLLAASLTLSSAASATEVTLGGTLDALVLGPNHELYNPDNGAHLNQPLTIGVGGRAGLVLARWLDLEGEVDAGAWPVRGGTTMITGMRVGPRFILRDLLGEGRHLHVTAGVGNLAVTGSKQLTGSDLDFAVHVGPGAELDLTDRLSFRADVLALLTSHVGSSPTPSVQTHLSAGMTYRLGHPRGVTAPTDSDGDWIADADDRCPNAPETLNHYADADGCPDTLAALLVTVHDNQGRPVRDTVISLGGTPVGATDAAGHLSAGDLMPGALALATASPLTHTRTAILTLDEGNNAVDVALDWLPGAVAVHVTDADGGPLRAALSATSDSEAPIDWHTGPDGEGYQRLTPGTWTVRASGEGLRTAQQVVEVSPAEDTLLELRVALDPARVEVAKASLDLTDQVLFETNQAVVAMASQDLLQEVAEVMIAHPEVAHLRIEGHTDSQGPAAANEALSQHRVDEVVRLLVSAGVDPSRLSAEGFGESDPIATNDTPEGRAQNRRVVFYIED